MTQRPLRVLLVSTHPVQYAAPIFRLLAKDPRIKIQVVYCSMQGAELGLDSGFGVAVKWDIPLLDGYPWICLPNRSGNPRTNSFFGLCNPGVWSLIRSGNFDAVVIYTGYVCATFWLVLLAARCSRLVVLFGTDAHELVPVDGKRWKLLLKRFAWPRLFRLADVVIVPSSGGVALMHSLRIPEDRVELTPYCVDNDWWISQSDRVERAHVRSRWNIPMNAVVVLFCAKLQPWKRPFDLLRAFSAISERNAYLIFAGEGPLRLALESEARSLGDRVRFLGFVNQSELPETYTSADLFVLPSDYEPFGVVVNEAMLCRCPVVVSDRVGARFDLVRQGETGFVFPAGNVSALTHVLKDLLIAPERLQQLGNAARERMRSWAPEQNVDRTVDAIERAVQAKRRYADDKPAESIRKGTEVP
jgi:glycosyltransferase involved in cell wall biosynthesis